MLKRDELAIPTSCLNKAGTLEPIFVLRAKDPLGPSTVRGWARDAELGKVHEADKVAEARALADRMEAWQDIHLANDRLKAKAIREQVLAEVAEFNAAGAAIAAELRSRK